MYLTFRGQNYWNLWYAQEIIRTDILLIQPETEIFLVLSCNCLIPIHWSQVLSREWGCSWSIADRWWSNYIWVVSKFIVTKVWLILEVWWYLLSREGCHFLMHCCDTGIQVRNKALWKNIIDHQASWCCYDVIRFHDCLYLDFGYCVYHTCIAPLVLWINQFIA